MLFAQAGPPPPPPAFESGIAIVSLVLLAVLVGVALVGVVTLGLAFRRPAAAPASAGDLAAEVRRLRECVDDLQREVEALRRWARPPGPDERIVR